MNTKILMTASSLILGIIGLGLSFLPLEIASYIEAGTNSISIISFQLMGALYLGFAMINWMSRSSIFGGIYNKPIVIGNFMHFGVGALALVKVVSEIELHQEIFVTLTVIYSIFALSFAYVFRTNPYPSQK